MTTNSNIAHIFSKPSTTTLFKENLGHNFCTYLDHFMSVCVCTLRKFVKQLQLKI